MLLCAPYSSRLHKKNPPLERMNGMLGLKVITLKEGETAIRMEQCRWG